MSARRPGTNCDNGACEMIPLSHPSVATRYIAVLREPTLVPGHCPACEGVLDDTRCRLGADHLVRDEARVRTGIARIVEVFCWGRPQHPVRACPSCGGGTP